MRVLVETKKQYLCIDVTETVEAFDDINDVVVIESAFSGEVTGIRDLLVLL